MATGSPAGGAATIAPPAAVASPTGDNADPIDHATAALYPDLDAAPTSRYLAVPNAARPWLLVPAASRSLTAAAIRAAAPPDRLADRLRRRVALAALAVGADTLLLRDRVDLPGGDTIDAHLRRALGTDIHPCIPLSGADHRLRQIRLLNGRADTVGFATVDTARTGRVIAETTALRWLASASLPHLRIPQVLYAGEWRGHPVLVREALPDGDRTGRDPHLMVRAMRELAFSDGVVDERLCDSRFGIRLRDRITELSASGAPSASSLAGAGAFLFARYGRTRLSLGCWHGEWEPRNVGVVDSAVRLWNFSRFASGVPLGFDALHFALYRALRRRIDPGRAVAALREQAPRLLRPFGIRETTAPATVLLYFVELVLRLLTESDSDSRTDPLTTALLRHIAEGGVR